MPPSEYPSSFGTRPEIVRSKPIQCPGNPKLWCQLKISSRVVNFFSDLMQVLSKSLLLVSASICIYDCQVEFNEQLLGGGKRGSSCMLSNIVGPVELSDLKM